VEDREAEQHRRFAVATFNAAWELMNKNVRTRDEDDEMLATTFASRYHWGKIGGPEQLATADWQVARAASLAGLPELALRFAERALERTEDAGLRDYHIASRYEGLARAHACAGNDAERDRYIARAKEALANISDADDREVIERQLSSVPGYG